MKLATQIWSYPASWDLERVLKTASEIGYEGIEISFDEKGPVSLESTKEDLIKVKELADKYNMKIYSIASGLYWANNLASDDAAVREKAKSKEHRNTHAFAQRPGCTVLISRLLQPT